MAIEIRRATLDDEAAVVAFTEDTWPGRRGDYVPRVFADWVASDDENQRTFVADDAGTAVGVVQGVLLTDREAWMQGMRIAPAVRGQGLSTRLNEAAADWARDRGAAIARAMVFSWNAPALAASRAAGFEPGTEFRWAHVEPDAAVEPELSVVADPAAGWTYWQRSAARDHLRGLSLAMEETWALRELTPSTLDRAATASWVGVVRDGGARGLAFRTRDYDREDADGETEHWAEYGVAAWADQAAATALLTAVARDAGALGVDRTRVLVPETVGAVSDAAVAGAGLSDAPDFVLEADLT